MFAACASGALVWEGLWAPALWFTTHTVQVGLDTFRASAREVAQLQRSGTTFMDLSGTVFADQPDFHYEVTNYSYPAELQHTHAVKTLLAGVNMSRVEERLTEFTSFYTRYYKSDYGLESAEWLEAKISEIVAESGTSLNVSISRFHHDFPQFSIIVRVAGTDPEGHGHTVVVGAHQDSANLLLPNLMPAPGADDDGLGVVTVLEALTLLLSLELVPRNHLEFHFYAAEEGGLLGLLAVFSEYQYAGLPVVAMLQQDMTGYSAGVEAEGVEPHMGLITDYTNANLNEFVKTVVSTLCTIPYHETLCGYTCLDHLLAIKFGFPLLFVIELEFSYLSKYIHSAQDTIDKLDFGHMEQHVRLTVGYAYELALAKIHKE